MFYFIILLITTWVFNKLYRFWTTTRIYSDLDQIQKVFDIKATYESESVLPPYPNLWYPVIQSRDLKPGQVKPLFVFEKHLVAFRIKSGKVHVLDAFCPHLGAHLGVGGTVVGDDIRCPFHSWTLNGQGQCTSVPGLPILPKVQLKSWKTIERNGWVFIWYHGKDQAPSWLPKEYIELRNTKHIGQVETYFNGHITDLLSNTADLDHFDAIHSLAGIVSPWQILTRGKYFKFMRRVFYFDFQANYQIGPEPHLATLLATITPILFTKPISYFKVKAKATLCPPVYHITTTLTRLNTSFYMVTSITPISPMKSHWFHNIYSGPGFKSELFARIAFLTVIPSTETDQVIYNYKKFLADPCLTRLDKTQAKFFRWFKHNFYSL